MRLQSALKSIAFISVFVQLIGCKSEPVGPVSANETAADLNWTTYGPDMNITALAVSGTNIFAGTSNATERGYVGGSVYVSADNGKNWQAINTGLPNQGVTAITVFGGSIYMGTFDGGSGDGLYVSSNNGATWQGAANGLPSFGINGSTAFATIGGNIFAGTGVGVFVSGDNGSSWQAASTGLPPNGVSALVAKNSDVVANAAALAVPGGTLFAGIWRSGVNGGIYVSNDNGTSWQSANNGLESIGEVYALVISGDKIFASTTGGENLTGGGVYVSADNGRSWQLANAGLPVQSVSSFAVSGNRIFAGTNGAGVYVSADNGSTWTAANNGITNGEVYALSISGNSILAATYNGLFVSPL